MKICAMGSTQNPSEKRLPEKKKHHKVPFGEMRGFLASHPAVNTFAEVIFFTEKVLLQNGNAISILPLNHLSLQTVWSCKNGFFRIKSVLVGFFFSKMV